MTRKEFFARHGDRTQEHQRNVLTEFLTSYAQEQFENARISVKYKWNSEIEKGSWAVYCRNQNNLDEYLGACGNLHSDINYVKARIRAIASRY